MIRRMCRQAISPLADTKPRFSFALAALALLALSQPAAGQLRQYSAPGQLAQRDIPLRDTLRERMASARWQAGRWRLQPRFSIGDLVYNNNVFDVNDEEERIADVQGSVAAGLDAYAPIGEDLVFATFARPSYNWWRDRDELRRLNWSYGAALLGLFNRLSTQLTARRFETERPINNELRLRAATRQDTVAFDTTVSLRGPWQVFGSVGLTESRYPNASALEDRAPALDLLARDEETISAGLAYDVPDRFNLGLGWRRVDSEFVNDPELRSNSGKYPFLTLSVPGNKLQIAGEVGLRQLEFAGPSRLAGSDELVASLRTSLELGRRTQLTVFGSRDIVYSAVDPGGFFASSLSGAALTWGDSDSLTTTFFAETGSDEFESASGMNAGRVDDADSYGIQFGVPLRWGLVMNISLVETTIDSTLDEFDRNLSSVSTSVRLDLPDFPF